MIQNYLGVLSGVFRGKSEICQSLNELELKNARQITEDLSGSPLQFIILTLLVKVKV